MHEITQKDVFLKESSPLPDADRMASVTPPAAPRKTLGLRPGPNRQSHQEAMNATFEQYDEAMRVLAGAPPVADK